MVNCTTFVCASVLIIISQEEEESSVGSGAIVRESPRVRPDTSRGKSDKFFRCEPCQFPLDGVPDPSAHLKRCRQFLEWLEIGFYPTRVKCSEGRSCGSRNDQHYMDFIH